MKRYDFIETVRSLGYTVFINDFELNEDGTIKRPIQNIKVSISPNKYLTMVRIDDTKPFVFETSEFFHILQKDKKRQLYDLVVKYAGTEIDDRN